jgi:3-oxoacyl-[acyl-carrier-protein] synthase II
MDELIGIEGLPGRPVVIGGVGLICPAGVGIEGLQGGTPGEVPGFRARDYIADRKSIKLMSRSVQLGVSAACLAAADDGQRELFQSSARGMYVGSRAHSGDPSDLQRALERSWNDQDQFDLGRFAREGIDRIHPLWLVKGLSNNVLGLTSLSLDIQGFNANYCHGEEGGWTAVLEAAHAVAEGRVDWTLAGASDSLLGAEELLGVPGCGEGAAFFVFRTLGSDEATGHSMPLSRSGLRCDSESLGYLGTATWAVALARKVLGLGS